jgi:hypothetical protein
MTWEEDVQEMSDEKLLSPDINRKGDRGKTGEAARKGEVWISLKSSIIYEEIWIDTQNFITPIGV